MDALFSNVTALPGVGAKRAQLLQKLGLETVYDVLYHIPRRYLDYSSPVPIAQTVDGKVNVICVKILQKDAPRYIRSNMVIYQAAATDGENTITITFFNNRVAFQMLRVGQWYRMSGKVEADLVSHAISSPQFIGRNDAHLFYPIYHLTAGLSMYMMTRYVEEALSILDSAPFETLPEDVREKRHLLPLCRAFHQIHFPKSADEIDKARRRLAFDELLWMHLGMLLQKEENTEKNGYKMNPETDLSPFYDALPFSPTQAQRKALNEITRDMCGSAPMNRLLQGDVGSGKTAVAAGACFFAIQNHIQCALMAPTEILASQHYQTLSLMLAPLGIEVGLLTGSLPAAQKKRVREKLTDGSIALCIGTHAIFQKDVQFARLGLVITDEQHRFGVAQRALLAKKGGAPHKLVMSATPIPRTLALMIYGDLDISILDQLPKGRLPIQTFAVTGALRDRAYGFIRQELNKRHQGYVVCPAIEENEESDLKAVTEYARKLQAGPFREYRVDFLHGKMKADEKEQIMEAFYAHEIDLLVSTTVIEVGIDVPNATILLVEDADRFGLSQLHQLRGRVGRGKAQSYCILMTDHVTDECRARMQIMSRTNDGFAIAQADLDLRGPGDFFGDAQHGLPPMKVANFVQDTALLEEVQQAAKEILRDDPNLSQQQNRHMRVEVLRLYSKIGDNSHN